MVYNEPSGEGVEWLNHNGAAHAHLEPSTALCGTAATGAPAKQGAIKCAQCCDAVDLLLSMR